MAEEWLTYSDLGERLGVSPEAARQKAIRARWRRRTANDGKAQVLVDVEDVKAVTPLRKPKDELPSDDHPTPDAQTLAALGAHIETLKAVATKAEDAIQAERQRADGERVRADTERTRADALAERLDRMRVEEADARAAIERDVTELRSMLEALKAPRPWWRRLVG